MDNNKTSLRSSSPLRSIPKCNTPSKGAVYAIEDPREMEAIKQEIYKMKRDLLKQLSSCTFFYQKAVKSTWSNSKATKNQLHSLMMLATASRLHSTRYLTYEMLLRLAKGVLSPRSLQYRLYSLRDAGFITIENQDGEKFKKTVPKFFILHRSGYNIIRIFEDYLGELNKEYDFNPFL